MSNAFAFKDEDCVPCRLCSAPTRMLGTKLCDGCYELESRIKGNPDLARKILSALTDGVLLADPKVMDGLLCEEASNRSSDTFTPCNTPAVAVVWYTSHGRQTHLMCPDCACRSVKERGARLLMTTDTRAIP
ncbi:MAG TPA: hypothetical protein VI653_07325 [Steroidobacteraceae bacterium]